MSVNQEETSEKTLEASQLKQHFISDENFQLLKQFQQAIFEATEVSPAIRKIVNELINTENLEKVKTTFIKIWR